MSDEHKHQSSDASEQPAPSGEPVIFPEGEEQPPPPSGAPTVAPAVTPSPESEVSPPSAPEPTTEPVPLPAPTQAMPATPAAAPAPAPAPSYAPPAPATPGAMPAPAPVATAAPSPKKKKSKKPLIITLSAVVVVIIAVVAVFGFQEMSRANAYDEAAAYFESEQYALAEEGFTTLGDYRDAAERAGVAGAYKDYVHAISLYDEGEYEQARDIFSSLRSSIIGDKDEWVNKCDYALADGLYSEGDLEGALDGFTALGDYSDSPDRVSAIKYEMADALYTAGDIEGAYEAFLALGSYSDAADRAAAIPQAFPASGVLYQLEGTYYAYAAIDIDYRYSSGGSYYKIYSGETLVATLFCNANSTVRVHLNPGNYTIKEGTGDIWFGEALAFGKNGYYSTMTYDDTGTDYFSLNDGDLVTITINSGTSGNVSERGEDLSSF